MKEWGTQLRAPLSRHRYLVTGAFVRAAKASRTAAGAGLACVSSESSDLVRAGSALSTVRTCINWS